MKTLKYFSLLVFTSCFYLTGCSDSESEHKKFGYRLGDMVKGKNFRDSKDGRELHFRDFPNSIATEYMRTTDDNNRFDLLIDMVHRRTVASEQTPPSDMLLIHLRIGDVIDKTPHMVKEFLERHILHNNGVNYVKPLRYYESILEKIKGENIRSVTLLGGFHTPLKSTKKSLEYVRRIRQFFEKNGYTVFERIDLDADDDFIYMCNAEYFTPSGGGYSSLVAEILKLKKKHVILPAS